MAKYIKLKGGEIATPQNEAKGRAFLEWYAKDGQSLIYGHMYDDEVATDTMINVYENTALKGYRIDNYKFYYLTAYRTNLRAARIKASKDARVVFGLEGLDVPAPVFDSEDYEATNEAFKNEIFQYVNDNYSDLDASLFQIYVELQPGMSYPKLSAMLDYPVHKIWPAIGAIRKDLLQRYGGRLPFYD